MSEGYIKLYRSLLDDHLFIESTPEQKVIMIALLLMVNHKENDWEWKGERYTVQPGQVITSLPKIAEKAGKGISVQNVRTALNRLKKHGFLTDKSTNKNRLITIVNWGKYQGSANESTDELTGNQQATNRQLTPNKNEKNEKKNTRKYIFEDTHLAIAEYFYKRILENNPSHKKPNLEKWADDIRKMMEIDKRTEEQIRYLIDWVQKDDFEMVNVLSPSKMRKRFDQLVIKVKKSKKRQHPQEKKEPVEYKSDSVDSADYLKLIHGNG
ncbi:hypothetical protein SAMN05192534_12330 [Alteribacillus persepolensis]|uniref:Uncharacterized protein n=1 Tax=Alteribacillus persepolensis TaxID=568899 RepID=A0A1G8I880_9BACI|nr:hypothetical protein [Alteribacillus persepolensis]SDI14951.1 hypothetical protein SAMN05192534_12330 [Alteribacillus persepolensis]